MSEGGHGSDSLGFPALASQTRTYGTFSDAVSVTGVAAARHSATAWT